MTCLLPLCRRFALASLSCLCLATAARAQAGDPVPHPDPASGDVVLFPGPLRPLESSDGPAAPPAQSKPPLGWHIPGRHYRGGEGWWALVCGQRCELSATRLTVSPARHEVYNSHPVPSQHLRWAPLPANLPDAAVADAGQPQLIAIFKPLRALATLKLAAGPVKTWLHGAMAEYPPGGRQGTLETRIPLDGGQTALLLPRLLPAANGSAAGEEASLVLELRQGDKRQRLGNCVFGSDGVQPVPALGTLMWAGDLDGDGKLDLIVRFASDLHVALYLSTLARGDEIVGLAGAFHHNDPSLAGW